jgi:hypothetical protein
MTGMVQDRKFQAEKEAQQWEANELLRATLGEMKGAFHHILSAKAAANPDVHNHHIYQDGRSVNVDGRSVNVDGRSVNVDARSMDARTVNIHNEQKLLHQQNQAAYNMQHNSSSSGLKRGTNPGDEEEVPANSSKRPPPAPPGVGRIRMTNAAQQFNIGDEESDNTPPPPPPAAPLTLHQIAANMLERERVEREQKGIFAKVGRGEREGEERRGREEEKGREEKVRSRSNSRKKGTKPTKYSKPTKNTASKRT